MRFQILILHVISLAMLHAAPAQAQFGQSESVMLINGPCELRPYQNKLKPDIRFDARRTLFQRNWVAVGGIRLGVQYRRVHRLGIGFYFLNTRIFERNFSYDIPAEVIEYDFGYTSLYYERALYFDRKWEFGANVHLGGGRVRVLYQPDGLNEQVELEILNFNATEIAGYGSSSVFYWLGVGTGMGYRRIWGSNDSVTGAFSTPIFTATVQLKIGKLARSIFNDSVQHEF